MLYLQGYGATAQTGYGQQDASTAYAQQQQNVYAGYTGQQTGTGTTAASAATHYINSVQPTISPAVWVLNS